ncbi:uncharacterized protein A4U43_C05F18390 [Asparagus officinalis]|uniref:Riboflavin kinase n=1 Tax=Asparagus officinalis TaxID=4686 RepID=A0A5P1ESJ3_ASPOF|nr:uncharacterized protein A4U43_C05F18390 [Asparagus officinalis]
MGWNRIQRRRRRGWRTAIVEDYELPMDADEFGDAIMPLYQERWHQAKALPGVNRLIRHLHDHGVPLALASNSIRKHIEMKISHQQGWKDMFSVILGGDEVNQGKPSPDIFLEAAKRLGLDASNCLVIEDSPVGVRAAKASGANVVAVPSLQNQDDHYLIANCVLHSLLEFKPDLWGLPAFSDWVQNALPIDPLCIRGLIDEGIAQGACTALSIVAEESSLASLPDQVSGVFLGWARLQIQGIFKVAATIGWDLSSGTSKREIKPCLFGDINNCEPMEQFQMMFVGYIRELPSEADTSEALALHEEDEKIAQAALDLPVFSRHRDSPLLSEVAFDDEACCNAQAN